LNAAAVYTGTLVVEQDGARLAARFDPARLEATAQVEGGALLVRWKEAPGLAGALQGPAAGPSEARYDLRTLRGTITRDRKPLATETLTRLQRLVVLHTNDSHGQLIPFKDPATKQRLGGFAARATIVKRVRAEATRMGAFVLILDAGDVNTGVPESDLLDAIPDLEAMNAIGYHAMAVGNHEFDRGPRTLERQRRVARFPLLSANIVVEATGEPLFTPSVVLERDGLRVGILGLTTESAAYITLPENRAGLRFEPALEAAAREVPRLRQRADVVIALTHLGYYPDGNFGTSTPGDVNLVRAVKGIDLVIGGHTHSHLAAPVVDSGVPICQTQDRGRFVGRVDLLLDARKKVVRYEASLIPVVVEDPANPAAVVAEDPAVQALIQPFLATVNGALDEVVAQAPVVLDGERARVRAGDTNLAFLVTDAYRHAGQTEVAFAIGGGIRASIDAGPITYREVLTVLPFQNGLVKGKLTGAQLLEVLAIGARQVPPAGAWLHVSGITWTMEAGQAKDVRVAGAPIDPARVYTVTCDRFIGDGGEKYTPFLAMTERQLLPLVDNQALRRFLLEKGVPDPAGQRRLTVVSTITPAVAPAPAPAAAPGH
jgi:5'-nucleotidase / UDP-sugar diphosphatase